MVRRAYVRSGEQQHLRDRLRWHIQQALHSGGASTVLVLRPLAQSTPQGQQVVGFDPVVERIRELIRKSDLVETDPADGIGIVLHETGSEGARAVSMRLRDALGSPIPPQAPDEVAVAVAFGYAASSSFPGSTTTMEESRSVAHVSAAQMASPLEVISNAMLDAAWQPRTVLMLTLPVLGSMTQPTRRARREPDMVTEPVLPRCRTEKGDSLASEQMSVVGDASDAHEVVAQQHMAQRGHLRLVVNQQVALPEIDAMRALARTMGVPFVRMPAHLPRSCRTAVHPTVACELRAVAIGRTRGTLTIAMHDPSDTGAIQRLHALTGLSIFPVLAAPDEIDRALRQIIGS